ncbi:uncharacterized protein LOC141907487 isoform X2 [Tubulanus polymorphus]|uniref:uncharacterized protein LOC141907487 isoform X2 n=1 Tax=Tubulanus polymorphus TaxID=672921 RepID=UPI003DA5EA97
MMINDQVILEEDYDENYQPSEEEIHEYAQVIGIDPDNEHELLWIAREGINAPLPEHWKPCQDPNGDIYYFNFQTGDSIWDHPCDEYYRNMVSQERTKIAAGGSKKKGSKKDSSKKGKAGKSFQKDLGPVKSSLGPQGSLRGSGSQMAGSGSGLAPLKAPESPLSTMYGAGTMPSTMASVNSAKTGVYLKSEVKTGTRNSAQSSGGFSKSILSSRDENIQMMPSLSDEEEATGIPRYSLDVDVHDIAELGYEDSDEDKKLRQNHIEIADSDSSEDYGKDVDFGIDKNLSERIMDIDMLEPAAGTMPMEKDFDLSLRSSTTISGIDTKTGLTPRLPPGELKPLANDSRKQKAALAAQAAEKQAEHDKQLKEEEQKLRLSNERSLDEMKRKLEQELEAAKLELLEEKEERMRKLKTEIHIEQEVEEGRIRDEKETNLRSLRAQFKTDVEDEEADLKRGKENHLKTLKEAIDKEIKSEEDQYKKDKSDTLSKLQKEVDALQREKVENLEKEKQEILDKQKAEVDVWTQSEQKRLECEKESKLNELRRKFDTEIENVSKQIENTHTQRMDEVKTELSNKHEQEIEKLVIEIKALQKEEMLKKELEIKKLKEQQDAVSHLKKELGDVLQEKRKEILDDQEKNIQELRETHEKNIRNLQQEYKVKEQAEQNALEKHLIDEKKKLQTKLESELEYVKKESKHKHELLKVDFTAEESKTNDRQVRINNLKSELDKEESTLNERKNILTTKKEEIDKLIAETQRQENEFEQKRENMRQQLKQFESEKEEMLSKQMTELHTQEVESLKTEQQQLLNDIRQEKNALDSLRRERAELDSHISKQKRLTNIKSILKDQADEANQQSPLKPSEDETLTQENPQTPSQIDDVSEISTPKPRPRKISVVRVSDADKENHEQNRTSTQKKSHQRNRLESASDDSQLSDDYMIRNPNMRNHRMKEHLAKEGDSISRAREFLRKQHQHLKRRQTALKSAHQEWENDMSKQNQSFSNGSLDVLQDVKMNMDKESIELDRMLRNMSHGSRLLREKETRLRELEAALAETDEESDEFDDSFHPLQNGRRNYGDLALSDDELSSGISSNEFNLDDLLLPATSIQHQQNLSPLPETAAIPISKKFSSMPALNTPHPPMNFIPPAIAEDLQKINNNLTHVMSMLSVQSSPPKSPAAMHHAHSLNGLQHQPPTDSSPSHHYHLPQYMSTPHLAFKASNPYLNRPESKINFGSQIVFQTAEQALEKKWRKYFGSKSNPSKSPGIGIDTSRDVLNKFRENFRDPVIQPDVNVVLNKHRQWLKDFRKDLRIVPHHHTSSTSLQHITDSSLPNGHSKSELNLHTPTTAATTGNTVSKTNSATRLELDSNNEIRIRNQ